MNKTEQLAKIQNISNGRIIVSEESAVFKLFEERRKICQNFTESMTEVEFQYYVDYLNKIEDSIKLYLFL